MNLAAWHEYVGDGSSNHACTIRVETGTPGLGMVYKRSCNLPADLHFTSAERQKLIDAEAKTPQNRVR